MQQASKTFNTNIYVLQISIIYILQLSKEKFHNNLLQQAKFLNLKLLHFHYGHQPSGITHIKIVCVIVTNTCAIAIFPLDKCNHGILPISNYTLSLLATPFFNSLCLFVSVSLSLSVSLSSSLSFFLPHINC